MRLKVVKLVILDIDGVIYCNGGAAPMSREAVELMHDLGLTVKYLTNDSISPRADRAAELADLGFKISTEDIFTATSLAARQLMKLGYPPTLLLVDPKCLEEFMGANLDSDNPEVVIVGDVFGEFSYKELNAAFRAIRKGARFLATQKNRFSSIGDGPNIDVGFLVAGLEYCTGKIAEVAGKPSINSYLEVCRDANVRPENAIMISDDLDSDLLGAHNAGLATAHVTDYCVPGGGKNFSSPSYKAANVWDIALLLRTLLNHNP